MLKTISLGKGKRIYCVGMKGTGMSALAQLLARSGCLVSGSDTTEKFTTEEVLKKSGISCFEGFSANHVSSETELIAFSPAYNFIDNPELKMAETLGIPAYTYPEFLGILSNPVYAVGISGVNGKTSTTALCAVLADYCKLPVSVICGSAMTNFDGDPTLKRGDDFFIAETCEYKRAFLNYNPDLVLVTNIELDHTDYFSDIADMRSAFRDYIERIPGGGAVVYCADDKQTGILMEQVRTERKDLITVPYGFTANGDFRVSHAFAGNSCQNFNLDIFPVELSLHVPGMHNVLNAAGAIAVISILLAKQGLNVRDFQRNIREGLAAFRGTKRRTELYGEVSGILFFDDYGHHPTSIQRTLAGLKEFYPERRIIIDFMPHTYTRTETLLKEFASSFSDADLVVLNGIYASAREKKGNIEGRDLFNETKKRHSSVFYCEKHDEAQNMLKETLKAGDLFITMGAGDNWKICVQLFSFFKGEGNK